MRSWHWNHSQNSRPNLSWAFFKLPFIGHYCSKIPPNNKGMVHKVISSLHSVVVGQLLFPGKLSTTSEPKSLQKKLIHSTFREPMVRPFFRKRMLLELTMKHIHTRTCAFNSVDQNQPSQQRADISGNISVQFLVKDQVESREGIAGSPFTPQWCGAGGLPHSSGHARHLQPLGHPHGHWAVARARALQSRALPSQWQGAQAGLLYALLGWWVVLLRRLELIFLLSSFGSITMRPSLCMFSSNLGILLSCPSLGLMSSWCTKHISLN